MQILIDFFQKNPYMVLFGILLGLIGGIIGLISGWGQFYAAMRSRVTIPSWLLLLIFLSFTIVLARGNGEQEELSLDDFTKYEGKTFGVQTVVLDGRIFSRCQFNGTKLIFEGKQGTSISNCELNGISLGVAGDAERTLLFLTGLYKELPELRPVIDSTLEGVRTGRHPITSPITEIE